MPDQKVDNLLNLSMDATPKEREKSENLNVGYDPKTRRWDVIVKYSGPETKIFPYKLYLNYWHKSSNLEKKGQ